MILLALTFACAGKPSAAPPTPDGASDATPAAPAPTPKPDEAVPVTTAAGATPEAGTGTVDLAGADAPCQLGAELLRHETASVREPDAVLSSLIIGDGGRWLSKSDKGEAGGCLSEGDLDKLRAAIAAADIAAPPLDPGMPRCMAMPFIQHSVTAGDAKASWDHPCGPSSPTDTLRELLKLTDALITAG